MAARLLPIKIALITLLMEIRFTLSRLSAAKVLPLFQASFQALRDKWNAIQAKEIALNEQLSDSLALVEHADDRLDDFAQRFHVAVLALTGQNRKAPLYLHYFDRPFHLFVRPTLSGQLTAMASWIKSLGEPGTPPSLAAMLPELIALVAEGQSAAELRDDTRLKIKQFREVGERRQFIEEVNAERKELAGPLGKMAVGRPGSSADFVNGYYRVAEPGDDEEVETLESVAIDIARLTADLKAKQERLAELQKEAKDEMDKAAQRAAKQARIEELDREAAERLKEAEALRKELEEK